MARWENWITRFWSNVLITDNCWVWVGYCNNKGYGMLRRGGTQELVHRISYELHFKEKPNTMCVLHKCDNPPCVNPLHLFLGTKSDNTKDSQNKGRRFQPNTAGSKNGRSKLSISNILEIKNLLKNRVPQKEIANLFDISQAHVSRINTQKRWYNVKEVFLSCVQ